MTVRTRQFLQDEAGISWAIDLRADQHDRANRNLARKLEASRGNLPAFEMTATTEVVRLFVPAPHSNFIPVAEVVLNQPRDRDATPANDPKRLLPA